MLRCAVLLVAAAPVQVRAHGYMLDPPPRAAGGPFPIEGSVKGSAGSCASGICFWFSQGCTIGCKECGGSNGNPYCGNASFYASRETLPETHWSYPYVAKAYTKPPCPSTDPGCAVTRKTSCGANPFCAPGSAPVFNPCGVAGGDTAEGAPGNGGDPPPGYRQGTDGRTLAELPGPKRSWKRGAHVNASWSVIANHGGGCESPRPPLRALPCSSPDQLSQMIMPVPLSLADQYRLCKKIEGYEATEECFQQHPVEFAETSQYIEYCDSKNQYPPYSAKSGAFAPCSAQGHKIPATDISVGTVPAGSAWRRNPIPGCRSPNGGAFGESCGAHNGTHPDDYQFPPAGADLTRPGQLLGGFGAGGCCEFTATSV